MPRFLGGTLVVLALLMPLASSAGLILIPPFFSKAFSPDTVGVGVASTLTFTINNSGTPASDPNLDFTDDLPAGVVVASPANASNSCTGGTLTAVSGTGVISYTNGEVGDIATCMISVDVVAVLPGVYVNTTGDLTSDFGNSGTASDTLTVTAVAPGFGKAFSPATVGVGGTSTLTFTVDNTANAAADPNLDFTDNLPAGVVIATPANVASTCTGGTLTAATGTGVISYTGGTAPASGSCTIRVDVTSAVPGVYNNATGNLASAFGNSGTAADTLTVAALPLFSKMFTPGTDVSFNDVVTLTLTIDNTGSSVAQTGLAFTDNLPAGMEVAAAPNVANSCGGAVTATPGSGTVSLSGGSVGALSSCSVSADVLITVTSGTLMNLTGPLGTDLGPGPTAAASLNVVSIVSPIPTAGAMGLSVLGLLLALAAVTVLRRSP